MISLTHVGASEKNVQQKPELQPATIPQAFRMDETCKKLLEVPALPQPRAAGVRTCIQRRSGMLNASADDVHGEASADLTVASTSRPPFSKSGGSFSKSFKRELGIPEDMSSRDVPRFSVLASAGFETPHTYLRPGRADIINVPGMQVEEDSEPEPESAPPCLNSLTNDSFSKSFKRELGMPEDMSSRDIPRFSVLASAGPAPPPPVTRPV